MNEQQLSELIERHTKAFLDNISYELESSHDKWFDSFGFPLFGVTSKDYHEQVYFQSYLESYTRKMINGILKELVEEECFDEVHWPEFECPEVYIGYTNREAEEKLSFEFINRDRRIGYRYVSFYADEIEKLLSQGDIDSIVLIEWQSDDEIVGYEYADERAKVVLLWELFQELFQELEYSEVRTMYEVFITNVTSAVEKANAKISLATLPGFTPLYMHKNRGELLAKLEKDVKTLSAFYVRNEFFKSTEDNSKYLISTFNLNDYFLSNNYLGVLVGTSLHAKSFMTSEYLYRYFKNNPLFDYTPVVSGYIKAIEQLLDSLCICYRNSKHIQLDMRGYTMGNYPYFIDNHEEMLREELRPAKSYIIECLKSYTAECRNHLFHKDYFSNWDRVDIIRKNTLFLYVVLLGAMDPDLFSIPKAKTNILGMLNEDYDRLFLLLDKKTDQYYTIEFQGLEYSQMRKGPRYEGIEFDMYGLIVTPMCFKKFNYDHYEEVTISRKNLPSAIWSVDSSGEKLRKIWSSIH